MHLRRLISAVAATAALAIAPTAAFAYTGDEEELVVSDSVVAPGEPFNVEVDGGAESDESTLTVTSQDPDVPDSDIDIAGTQSMTKAANAAGVAEFTVTLYAEGRYTLTGYDEAGSVVGESVVVVGDAGASTDDSTESGTGLPATGSPEGLALMGGGGALLLAAGGVLLWNRRGKAQHS